MSLFTYLPLLILVALATAQSTITVTRTTYSPPATPFLSTLSTPTTSQPVAPQTPTSISQSSSQPPAAPPAPAITAVSECHMHATVQFCMAGTVEYQVLTTATGTSALPAQYTGCHAHGSETFCLSPSGDEVELRLEGADAEATDLSVSAESEASGGERNCHFHAGVEHCVGGDASEETSCERVDRGYNVPLRIGLLFVILVTSAIGVFVPILLTAFTKIKAQHTFFVVLKQFGTGVILSTAFVHLYTHASLMFGNECLGELSYEATTSALLLAGFFLSFMADYSLSRFLLWRQSKRISIPDTEEPAQHTGGKLASEPSTSSIAAPAPEIERSSSLNVLVLEAGIIFHSLLIGLTLVVAGDSFFLILFAVIIFHQMFEGIALGTMIAALPSSVSLLRKLIMGTAFAFITPIGMAIGIGVLSSWNGNDPSTIVAIGTLNAVSAGILVWVGIVEMWAADWIYGDLKNAPLLKTCLAMGGLVSGLVVMSVLGKWA